jgi:hypothetical protein
MNGAPFRKYESGNLHRSHDEGSICNTHAGFNDGLADGLKQLFHVSSSPFQNHSGVFYISLSTDRSAGSNRNSGGAPAPDRWRESYLRFVNYV